MGSCCAGRSPNINNANPYFSNFEQSPDSRMFSYKISHFYSKNNVFSRKTDISAFNSNSEINSEEIRILKGAKKSKNLELIVSLINSKTPLPEEMEVNHIWASRISCVGALASLYATMFFHRSQEVNLEEELEEENLFERYSNILLKENIGKKLKENLGAQERDLWELTIIFLGFLTDENKLMQDYFAEIGFLNYLINYLSPYSPETKGDVGIRVAVLQIVRDISKGKKDCILRFVNRKGFEMIFDILESDDPGAICEVIQTCDELSIDVENPEKRYEFVMEELDELDIYSKLQALVNRTQFMDDKGDPEAKENVEKYAIFLYNVCCDYS